MTEGRRGSSESAWDRLHGHPAPHAEEEVFGLPRRRFEAAPAEHEVVLHAYELAVEAAETLSRHGMNGPRMAELKAAAARMNTLDEALTVIRQIHRLLTAVIACPPSTAGPQRRAGT